MEQHQVEMSEIHVGYLISKAALYFKVSALQEFKLKKFNITPEQFVVLYVLTQENGLYQRQLAKIILKDRPNMTRIINILEKKNFLLRKVDPNNRRIFKIFITEEGREQVKDILPSAVNGHQKSIEGLSQEDLSNLSRILGIICDNLNEKFKLQI